MIAESMIRTGATSPAEECPACLGQGVIWKHLKNQAVETAERCQACQGSGRRRSC